LPFDFFLPISLNAEMTNLFDLVARIFISSVFLLSGINKIFNYGSTVTWMEGFGVPGFLLWPTIVLEILLPIFIIIGYKTQLSAILLAIFCIATALIFHFDLENQMQVTALLKNFGLAGGFIFIAISGPKDWAMDKTKKYVRL
jgi:putative oxidoreductase|tara:strand:+ start:440 stop:868 length:429 start_codon:yes stop_codon:yes gene_type:complete